MTDPGVQTHQVWLHKVPKIHAHLLVAVVSSFFVPLFSPAKAAPDILFSLEEHRCLFLVWADCRSPGTRVYRPVHHCIAWVGLCMVDVARRLV